MSPAATSASTGSVTGFSALAVATSAAMTAYPSMAELSKPGSDQPAVASSASTAPSAWVSARSSGGTGTIAAMISLR